jgi:shikimate kinase
MIIILMGYMGSGKSKIGNELAQSLDYNFIDLDDYIANKEALSIAHIFENKGEIYFRKQEHFYLGEILSSVSNCVLSLGGGTPCYGDNLSLISNAQKVISFYLKVSLTELVKRLVNEKEKRPIISHLKNKIELTEFIGKHLFERHFFYSQSTHTIGTDNLQPKEIIASILLKLV